MTTKLAIRNLFRNRWRSGLTAGGIALATALLIWSICLFEGMLTDMVRGATAVQIGQVQIHAQQYAAKPSLYDHLPYDPGVLAQIRAVPGVIGVAPRARVFGLAGNELNSQVAQIVGVEPDNESNTTIITEGIEEGRWLSSTPRPLDAPREVVIGHTYAQQLQVRVGDEIVLFLQSVDGSLGNDLLEVVGILRTGNLEVDRQALFMNLVDLQYDAALDGRIHEVAIRLDDLHQAPAVARIIDSTLGRPDQWGGTQVAVRPWQEVVPGVQAYIELGERSMQVTIFLVYLVVALGLLNTQRMSALERRREFGVLMAIGLKPKQLRRMVVVESVLLTAIGALTGVVLGFFASAYTAHFGLNMALFSERADMSYMGVAFSERFYAVLSVSAFVTPLVVISLVAVLCGLWPAIKSARLNMTQAISGRT